MKKIILIFAVTVLAMCSTACSARNNLPNIQPQNSTEETTSSTDSTPESKSDAADSNDSADAEIPASKPAAVLDGLEVMLDGYDCAIAYVGYTETADVNSVRECAAKSLVAARYPFISDISNGRIILAGGGEIFCVIPAKTASKVTVNYLDRDENGAGIIGDELYSGGSEPILISCNVSDIMPNASVKITNGDKTFKFSPFLSLRDGRISLPEDLKALDFSEYGF